MSGHSKWHSIKYKKGAIDAQRGKIFTQHAHLISLASKAGGSDVNMNPSLKLAIDNAKKANVPNANIERAIKRGAGELKGETDITEIIYEGYGPAGTAVIVECLSDNKNRTFTNIRTIFNKKGGNIGTSGSVSWMFERKGIITINLNNKNQDEIELNAIDAGAIDIKVDEDIMEVFTNPSDLISINNKLNELGIETENAESSLVASNTIKIENKEDANKVLNFIDLLEDDEDVSKVYSNFDINNEILEELNK